MDDHDTFRAVIGDMLRVLSAAQEERHLRQAWVDGELGWVLYEREVMLAEVNRLRAQRGLDRIHMDRLRRVERMAEGHIDYSEKFALYCAELALGLGVDRP